MDVPSKWWNITICFVLFLACKFASDLQEICEYLIFDFHVECMYLLWNEKNNLSLLNDTLYVEFKSEPNLHEIFIRILQDYLYSMIDDISTIWWVLPLPTVKKLVPQLNSSILHHERRNQSVLIYSSCLKKEKLMFILRNPT